MSKGTTHTFLLFDAACSACSRLALEIELETDWMLCARSLREPIMQAWLEQARPGWCWEPTLLEVDGEHSRAFIGLAMAFRLVQVLGLRRAGRVARLVQRASVPSTGMHAERRQFLRYSGGMVLTLLGSSLLAACGGSTTSPTSGPATASAVKGDFVGEVAGLGAGITLSTNGQTVVAYICDGIPTRVTIAQWFNGSVSGNAVDMTAAGVHLVAMLTSTTAMGTVTLMSGQRYSFTASVIDGQSKAGVYRSEQTIGGVRYLGGWTVLPSSSAQAPHQVFTSIGLLDSWLAPVAMGGGNAIGNEQTGALLPVSALTFEEVASKKVVVPGLGTFMLTLCRLGTC